MIRGRLLVAVNVEILRVLHVVLDNYQKLLAQSSVTESVVHCEDCCHHVLNHDLPVLNSWSLFNLPSASQELREEWAGDRSETHFETNSADIGKDCLAPHICFKLRILSLEGIYFEERHVNAYILG